MSGLAVCEGALLRCKCLTGVGEAVIELNVLPKNRVVIGGRPMTNIASCIPEVNIPPGEGICTGELNPEVIALTLSGDPEPTGACTPMPIASWLGGNPKVLVGGLPSLTVESKIMCAFGGEISVMESGQFTVTEG